MGFEPVLMNDFKRQWTEIASDCLDAVNNVGASGWYVLGSQVSSFETDLAVQSNVKFSVGCANGLDAIEIALRALGLQAGDKVLTTPLSAFATTLAILRAGGVPVFCDVDAHGHLDLDEAEAILGQHKDIRYMVPVHLFGHPLDLTRLEKLRDLYDLKIVEDAAQAVGASFGGRPIGSVGQAATLSFYPTKNLGALGDAGALLTNDEHLSAQFRTLRDYGQSAKYVHSQLGMNSRLDELHAAILKRAMLPRLSAWIERRREIAARYIAGIQSTAMTVILPPAGAQSVWHLFGLRVVDGNRDLLAAHLHKSGIQSGVHYPHLIPHQEAMKTSAKMQVEGRMQNAADFAAQELSLPIHPYLSDVEVDRVIETVNNWRGQ